MIKIIAPKVQHDIISKHLLENNNIVTETSILPLTAFINTVVDIQDNNYDNLLKIKLDSIENKLKVLSHYIDNQEFIKSIKDFHIDMHLYNIKLNDLKSESVKDKDLKIIFDSIEKFIPNEIITLNKLKKVITPQLLENVYISKQKINSNYSQAVVDLLKDNGVKDFEELKYSTKTVELYYANNKRSEVEASAQMIINKDLSNAQVIVLNQEYLPLVEQVYSRYNIDYSAISATVNNSYYINFIKAVKLIEEPTEASVKEFLSSNPLQLENISSLIKLNDMFNFNLNRLLMYKYIPIEDSIVHKSNLDHYKEIAKAALVPIAQLNSILKEVRDINNKQELIEFFFNYFLDLKESSELRKLRSVLMNNKKMLSNSQNVYPILEKLLLKNINNAVDINKVVVCDINNHYYFNKNDVIILGATANNYPLIKKHTGVIDENYLEHLNYPKKADRFEKQLDEQETILTAKHLYVFYPLSSYSGKAVEPSFSLINYANKYNTKAKRYNLIENDHHEFKQYTLRPDLAEKLFFKDNKLSGSISSFEQYNNCPYSYFLKSGLKLYPKEMPDLSYAYIGSMIHAVMEEVVNRQIDNKDNFTEKELKEYINRLAVPLEALNPSDEKVRIVKHLLNRQLSDVLKHFNNIEADTRFEPIKSEAEFFYTINNNIDIRGYVDRTDRYMDALRVIDFKSSNKTLSEKKFKQGLQLQLITYLLVMSEHYGIKPSGAFYHTMRLNNTNVVAGQAKKTKDMFYPLTEEQIENDFLQSNRLSGWHFMDAENFYDSKNYVGGLTENKAGLSVYGKPKNFNTVITILEEIYKDIYDNLKAGKIDCKPVDGPCAFCQYHSICLSKSTNNYKAEIYQDQKLSEEINNEMD